MGDLGDLHLCNVGTALCCRSECTPVTEIDYTRRYGRHRYVAADLLGTRLLFPALCTTPVGSSLWTAGNAASIYGLAVLERSRSPYRGRNKFWLNRGSTIYQYQAYEPGDVTACMFPS